VKNGALARRDVITYFTLAATTQMMRILVTGASSPLAVGVMRQLLLNSDLELWAGRHRKAIPLSDPRLHAIDLDLEKSDLTETLSRTPVDMVIHFAGVTHASDEQQYWKVNFEGTRRLAQAAHGCAASPVDWLAEISPQSS